MVSLVNYKVTDNMPGIIVRRGNDKISLAPFDKIYDKRESIHIKKESNINSGIYINFQEYFDVYFDRLFDKVSNIKQITLVDKDGNEINYGNMLEYVFSSLRDKCAFTLGREYKHQKIDTFADLERIISSHSLFISGIKLRRGMYVEMHTFMRLLDNYKFKVEFNGKDSGDLKKFK